MEDMAKLLALLQDIDEDIDFEQEKALVDDGLLDSLSIVTVIAAIDDAFGVHIRVADIGPEHMNSVEAMLEMINRYRGKA